MTNSEQDLRPCPFCGSRDVKISPPVNDGPEDVFDCLNQWQVGCHALGCEITGPSRETEEECIAAWNSRVGVNEQQAAEIERLKSEMHRAVDFLLADNNLEANATLCNALGEL